VTRSKEGTFPVPLALLLLPPLPSLSLLLALVPMEGPKINSMSIHNRPGSRERRGEKCAAVVARLYTDLTRVKLLTEGERKRGEKGGRSKKRVESKKKEEERGSL
jgi:hypothetical protein